MPVLFSHIDNLNIHHLENWRDISGGNWRRRWIYPDFVLSLCHRNSLYITIAIELLSICSVRWWMGHILSSDVYWEIQVMSFYIRTRKCRNLSSADKSYICTENGWQYDRKRKLPVWRGVCKGYCPLGIDGTTSPRNIYWFGAYNGCMWICKDKYPGNKLILSQPFIQFSHHPVI